MFKLVAVSFFLSSFFFIRTSSASGKVKPGIDVLAENPIIIKGKKIGIITNHTAFNSGMLSTADIISGIPGTTVVALYAPEHGFRGGKTGFIDDHKNGKTGIRVFSLHGKTRSPTDEMLNGIDILIFDIQDIGARSYTYISTMKNCMEAAARHEMPFVVLDRPNPLGGLLVDGPVLDMKFASFIGPGPVAYIHGMTAGELALFFNSELGINCNLKIVPMEGWRRDMRWKDTGLVWSPTSPHIPEPDTPLFYAATGILGELPLVNIGVGYTLPFKIVGAPWINAEDITARLNGKNLPGVYFQPFYFTPFYRHYKDKFCEGFRIIITDANSFRPVETGYHIIETLLKLYPEEFNLGKISKYCEGMFNQANGTDRILRMFKKNASAQEIIESYEKELEIFMKKRKKYLIYE